MKVMEGVTRESILKFISKNKIELSATHSKLCVPIIDRMYRKMLAGIRFQEIKIADGIICDGHHRYLASLLAKFPIGKISGIRTSATIIVEWESVFFEEIDWDSPVRIKILNERDAAYNNIPIEKLVELLK